MRVDTAHNRALTGGLSETFSIHVAIFDVSENADEWADVREQEIELALVQLAKAIRAWANKARREKLKAEL